MASPQVEDGHLKIADSLVVAICKAEFTAIQYKVLLSIMNMTYRVGKTKAEISIADLRYATNMKKYRVEKALNELIEYKVLFHQTLIDGNMIYGIQKDYEKWQLPQMGNAINSSNSININTTRRGMTHLGNGSVSEAPQSQKKNTTPPQKFLNYVLKDLGLNPSMAAWRAEHKRAVQLYQDALDLAHSPVDAMTALVDYFDSQATTSFRAKIRYPIAALQPGFTGWYRQVPDKPSKIKFQEKVTGKRWRYDLQKGWVESEHRI